MANHQIEIGISTPDQKGNVDFFIVPSLKRVYREDTITWTCTSGPFAVLFHDRTPCDQMDARSGSSPNTASTWTSNTLTVRDDTAGGHYHYSVAVFNGSYVYLDAGCPDLIVN